MDQHKEIISIDYAKCAPCSMLLCVGVCPQGVLEAGADNKPRVIDGASCNQCGICVNLCTLKAIKINSDKNGGDKK